MQLSQEQIIHFQETIWSYYTQHGRNALPWRQPESNGELDPYKIMVSELMLQQTQVKRVIPKYEAFLEQFPDIQALTHVGLGDVLRAWQGLGYNRRAKFLWQTAQMVVGLDKFPATMEELVKLPGIGKNTAGAILAYAYNQPAIFIETNVRTVYIYHFFTDEAGVSDTQIIEVVEQTIDQENPREFYWALMDYGSHLKAMVGNLNRASKQFAKQSKFYGSRRQIRGQVLRLLGVGIKTREELDLQIGDERLEDILIELVQEQLIREKAGTYSLD